MKTANKDGRTVLAYSYHFGMVPVRWIDTGLPKWVESSGETGLVPSGMWLEFGMAYSG
jgi:hypothetical protein